ALVAELAVEALRRAILPRLARIDQCGSDTLVDNPLQQCAGDELRPVVRAQTEWRAALRHQSRQHFDHAIGADAAVDLDRKTFFGPFVGDRQALQLLTVGAPIEHEVVGPHLVGAGWRVGTRTAGRDALSRALARHLKARLPPQAIGAS